MRALAGNRMVTIGNFYVDLTRASVRLLLPLAIVVNSWDSLSEWRRSQLRTPIAVERGTTQAYAGAQWQLAGLTRLPGATPETALIVAESEPVFTAIKMAGAVSHRARGSGRS